VRLSKDYVAPAATDLGTLHELTLQQLPVKEYGSPTDAIYPDGLKFKDTGEFGSL
jgi:hypothetical protein